MYVNSPGGSVYAGLAIYDTMQYIKPDVQTICVGVAMSMGALLLAGGAADKRMALPNSKILIHQVSGRLLRPGDRHRDPRQGDHRRPPPARRDHLPPHRPAVREGRQGHRARLLHERRGGQGVQDRRPGDRAPLGAPRAAARSFNRPDGTDLLRAYAARVDRIRERSTTGRSPVSARSSRRVVVIAAAAAGLALPAIAGAATINVNPGKNAIQKAVNKADNGDTLRIHSGTYKGHVNVDKKLRLTDAGDGRPLLDGAVRAAARGQHRPQRRRGRGPEDPGRPRGDGLGRGQLHRHLEGLGGQPGAAGHLRRTGPAAAPSTASTSTSRASSRSPTSTARASATPRSTSARSPTPRAASCSSPTTTPTATTRASSSRTRRPRPTSTSATTARSTTAAGSSSTTASRSSSTAIVIEDNATGHLHRRALGGQRLHEQLVRRQQRRPRGPGLRKLRLGQYARAVQSLLVPLT